MTAGAILASVCAGLLGALGLGGGGVLLLYLTLWAGVGQLEAQGINLLFFLPTGLLAVVLHTKAGLISWRTALPAVATGVAGVFLGSYLAQAVGEAGLRKIFGLLVLILGIRELFAKKTASPGED